MKSAHLPEKLHSPILYDKQNTKLQKMSNLLNSIAETAVDIRLSMLSLVSVPREIKRSRKT